MNQLSVVIGDAQGLADGGSAGKIFRVGYIIKARSTRNRNALGGELRGNAQQVIAINGIPNGEVIGERVLPLIFLEPHAALHFIDVVTAGNERECGYTEGFGRLDEGYVAWFEPSSGGDDERRSMRRQYFFVGWGVVDLWQKVILVL